MRKFNWFGKGLPKISPPTGHGKLIVLEGQDGAGRSTHVSQLKAFLENKGYPTTEIGLKRSRLAGKELNDEMKQHSLAPTTMTLFYATDLADQLEHQVLPALNAGFIVVADRYIFSLIARAVVRGLSKEWVTKLYGFALKPHASYFLSASPQTLASRSFFKGGSLNFWESGQDIEGGSDIYQRFIRYQTKLNKEFKSLIADYKIQVISADRDEKDIQEDLQLRVMKDLFGK